MYLVLIALQAKKLNLYDVLYELERRMDKCLLCIGSLNKTITARVMPNEVENKSKSQTMACTGSNVFRIG